MRILVTLLLCVSVTFNSAHTAPIQKIAFGSCLRQNQAQPIWSAISATQADMFLFLGDNIYADTKKPNVMMKKYQQLAQQPGYQQLLNTMPVYSTWDDHDYGQNDAGLENPIKVESEKIFLDFFNVPQNSPRRSRPGIYGNYIFGPENQRVQIILLDTRFFRGPAVKGKPTLTCKRTNYAKQTDPAVSVLGDAQWLWLEQQLMQPADLRIIASSIQFIAEEHCWEKWANFPLQKQKMLELISKTKAKGIIFISGDRHLAEISKLEDNGINYPIYEVTSSGMNSAGYGKGELNRYRITEDNFRENNFGLISINWDLDDPEISLIIKNEQGKSLYSHTLKLGELNKPH